MEYVRVHDIFLEMLHYTIPNPGMLANSTRVLHFNILNLVSNARIGQMFRC